MLDEIIHRERQVILQTYQRAPILWESGHGIWLVDSQGEEYLDMGSGIAVNALGYQHPAISQALSQSGLIHTSNLYYTRSQIELAQTLCDHSFASKVFFCNSGTEANEGAIKFARKFAKDRYKIVAFNDGFHGRTIGALACTANPRYRHPFEPLMPGVNFADYNQLDSVNLDDGVAAVIVEPIQGEGGVLPAQPEFLQGLRRLCDAHDVLLIFDEVQCGLGRTGTLWAYQQYGIIPDIITLAKPLGGGLPIGAILVNDKVANAIEKGDHGSTFAGGPLVTGVAQSVLATINQPGFLEQVNLNGKILQEILQTMVDRYVFVKQARGCGLMWGLELDAATPVSKLVEAGYSHKLVMLSCGHNSLRLLPPLIITPQDLKIFEVRLNAAMEEVSRALA